MQDDSNDRFAHRFAVWSSSNPEEYVMNWRAGIAIYPTNVYFSRSKSKRHFGAPIFGRLFIAAAVEKKQRPLFNP